MSLHANLSPEALKRIHTQSRNSTIFSIIIALTLGVLLLPTLHQETPTIVTYQAETNEEAEAQQEKARMQIQRKPARPPSSMAKVIAADTAAPTAIPVPDVLIRTPLLDFGFAMDFGEGWGDGNGASGGGGCRSSTCDLEQKTRNSRINTK